MGYCVPSLLGVKWVGYVAQAGLELVTLLPKSSNCYKCGHGKAHLLSFLPPGLCFLLSMWWIGLPCHLHLSGCMCHQSPKNNRAKCPQIETIEAISQINHNPVEVLILGILSQW